MESTFERNYSLEIGDVVLVSQGGYGLVWEDKEKYVEIVGKGNYFGREGVRVKPYQCKLETLKDGTGEMGVGGVIGYETFGDNPLVLLNTGDEIASTFNPSLETRKNDKNQMELVDTGFPNALLMLGEVMTWAAKNKGYQPHDWANIPNPEESFIGAATRHRLKSEVQKNNGVPASERTDEESGLLHKTHELFNVLAQLELILRGKIK